jgi:exopolysaccharide biosynthesis polyprenyl glycosylphosphotransferase
MYSNKKNSILKHWDFIILDLFVLQISFVLAYMIRHGVFLQYNNMIYVHIAVVIVMVDFLVVVFLETYKDIVKRGYLKELKAIVIHVSSLMLMLFAYMFITKTAAEYSRTVFLLMWLIAIVLMWLSHLVLKHIVRRILKNKIDFRTVVLITSGKSADESIDAVRKITYRDYRVIAVAFLDESFEVGERYGITALGSKCNLLEYLQKNVVDEVFINLPNEIPLPSEIIQGCVDMGITLHLALSKLSNISGDKVIEEFAGYTVMTSGVRIARPRQVAMKRLMDIAGGLVGLLITAVLFIFVAPLIFIKSPGPVFFSQYRVGKNGRLFKIYKFRSMYMDAEERKKELMKQNEMNGLMFKIKDDPRIIKGIGHFIRKTSIDEFPQFWNVLKGEMSLVGTRPPTVDEYEHYDLHHKKRLSTKPGITGMWQVSGRSNVLNFEDVVKMDIKYIEQWSIGLDIKILFQTVGAVLGSKGAS